MQKRRIMLSFIVLSVFSCCLGAYLNNVTGTSITVSWLTDVPVTSKLEIHKTNTTFLEDGANLFHSFDVTGLSTDTAYSYTITNETGGKVVNTETGVFWTAPERKTPFKFVLFGDSRNNESTYNELIKRIEGDSPQLVIHTGDIVYDDSREDEWRIFLDGLSQLETSVVYAAIGNHEKEGLNFKKYFSLPGNESYYSFWYSDLLFIVLNTNQRFDNYSEQYKWFEETLKTEKNKKPASILVIFHHPPYSYGIHGDHLFVKMYLVPLMEKYGVDLVINGHDHGYQRLEKDGLTYLITAGGGAPLYRVEEGDKLVRGFSDYHYVLMEYDGKNLNATVKKLDGQIVDSFHVKVH